MPSSASASTSWQGSIGGFKDSPSHRPSRLQAIDDRFVNFSKLHTRLNQLFDGEKYTCGWKQDQWIIEDAPRELEQVCTPSPRAQGYNNVGIG
jgi:hypothetical protein